MQVFVENPSTHDDYFIYPNSLYQYLMHESGIRITISASTTYDPFYTDDNGKVYNVCEYIDMMYKRAYTGLYKMILKNLPEDFYTNCDSKIDDESILLKFNSNGTLYWEDVNKVFIKTPIRTTYYPPKLILTRKWLSDFIQEESIIERAVSIGKSFIFQNTIANDDSRQKYILQTRCMEYRKYDTDKESNKRKFNCVYSEIQLK